MNFCSLVKKNKKIFADFLFFVLVVAFAYSVNQGLWLATAEGVYNPYKSDVEEYSGRLASQAYPQNFKRDALFAHPSWTTSFPNIQVWLGELFPAQDNFNWSLMRHTGPLIVIFYIGFYLLGTYLFKSRLIACLLACAEGLPDIVGFGTFWGICTQPPVPRSYFDAILPYMMLFASYAIKRPKVQPLVMLSMGCMVYSHGISAMVMGGSFFIAFLFLKPKQWTAKAHIYNLAFSLLAYALPFLVFSLPVISSGEIAQADSPVFAEMFQKNFMQRFGAPFDDCWKFFLRYTFERPLAPLAILGGIIAWKWGDGQLRAVLKLNVLWLVGIFFCAVCINWLEQEVMASLGRVSILHQLIRGLRFCIPVFYLIMACGLKAIFARLKASLPILLFWALFLFLVIGIYPYLGRLAYYAGYWINTRIGTRAWYCDMFDKQTKAQNERRKAILAVRKIVPESELVFSNTGDTAIRYLGLRSLAYASTDGNHYYIQHDALGCRRWLDNSERLSTPLGYIRAWLESDAEWLLTDQPQDRWILEKIGSLAWKGEDHVLYRKFRTGAHNDNLDPKTR